MFSLFSQPYPTEEPVRRRLIVAFSISAFIGVFLLVFQPFGLDDWQPADKLEKILGFGLVTFLVMIADSLLLPALFPRYFLDDQWTVGWEIVRTTVLLAFIATGNWLYLGWLLGQSATTYSWVQMLGMTFIVGIFPTVGLVLLNYIVQLRKYSAMAAELPDYSDSPERIDPSFRERVSAIRADDAPNTTLTLVADNEKDALRLRPETLLFIESSDNYCTVVYLKSTPTGSDQPVKPLIRSSLSRLETQIIEKMDGRPHIVRCHRSYIVNLDRVERVTGNAQGYKLHLWGGQFQVPVARRFNDSLIIQLKP